MTQNRTLEPCPICTNSAATSLNTDMFGSTRFECPRCGTYSTFQSGDLKAALGMDTKQVLATLEAPYLVNSAIILPRAVAKCACASKPKFETSEARAILSHVIRRMAIKQPLTTDDFSKILVQNVLPNPTNQASNFLKFIGDELHGLGDKYYRKEGLNSLLAIGAIIGSRIGLEYCDIYALIVELLSQKIITVDWDQFFAPGGDPVFKSVSLTLLGWETYETLDRNNKSKTAFVAMKFKSSDDADYYFQDELLPKYLMAAVKQAGFVLSNPLSEYPQAGNLHARLEVEIKNARFVVAELSHSNNGAYWEAGFAKGLGKPVIYMYCKDIGQSEKPHFDVGSDQIIFWEKEQPDQAAQSLKDIIRNTLFSEAKQND